MTRPVVATLEYLGQQRDYSTTPVADPPPGGARMTDRRSFLRACLAAGGLTFVPKALDRYKWVKGPVGIFAPSTGIIATRTDLTVLYRKVQGALVVGFQQQFAEWEWHNHPPLSISSVVQSRKVPPGSAYFVTTDINL